jgi:pyruvate,water dikinase
VRLSKAGARVPRAFAVTTLAYRKFMVQLGSKVASILEGVGADDISGLEEASKQITEMVKGNEVPGETAKSIAFAYRELARAESGGGDLPVAVRSSATAEDMLSASVAGQHETFLWVKGGRNVVDRVRDCWASAFATRSLSYRRARGISQVGVEMGVAVQKMVESRKSGVMFTLNPINGDASKIAIDATWGLGEAEVGGVVTPDFFLVDKVTLEVLTKRAGKKKVEFIPAGNGVQERPVPAERQEMLCLEDVEVLELARVGKALEKFFGSPQDIEWAMDDAPSVRESLYILQARPETVWSGRTKPKTAPKGTLDTLVDALKRGRKVR